MRLITIFLILILIGCKSETKNKITKEEEIDKSVYEMWDSFTSFNTAYKEDKIPDSWYFHNNKEDANRLADLIVNGKKKAGSGLYSWYKEANADLPKIGTKHIITDFSGKAKAIIEIKKVDTIPFNKISAEYAEIDMGTSIEPLKKWKKAHWDFFKSVMSENGQQPTENMLIVCEWFETVWPEKH